MKLLITLLILTITLSSSAQETYTGIVSDNYVSSNVSSYNPSSIVDSKSRLSFSTNFNNSKISNFCSSDYAPYGTKNKYIDTKHLGYIKRYLTVELLNFKYELNHKNAIAYSFKIKSFNTVKGMPTIWSENAVNSYQKNIVNQEQSIVGLSFTRLNFTEHAFTYARTIFDNKTTFLKVGGTFKILNGINAKYFYANDGSVVFNSTSPDLLIKDINADFGESVGLGNQLRYKNKGLGLDLGFTYEIRPDEKAQYYDMDGETDIVRYDMNKYKWKFAASITDIGFIRYMKDTTYYNFSKNSISTYGKIIYSVDTLFNNTYSVINGYGALPGVKLDKQETKFIMNLPTTLHLSVDYNVKRNIYVSYNASIPFIINADDKTRISNFFIHTITPRVEKKNYSVMMPFSQMGNGKFYIGLAGRITYKKISIFTGSNNMAMFYGQKSSLGRNFYFGVSYSILYKVKPDKDLDKVSDGTDECPDDKGTFEFLGCPDSDGDKIIDKIDHCIYDPGTKLTNGCPDTDGDGIIDMNDMCPTQPGLPIHYGCPDRDFDGVIDAADKCPDIPGIEFNNGCPLENQGCCNDNDGDGVSNSADKCPDVSGSVYNDGCPITKENIDKIKLKEQKNRLDANNTNEQIYSQELPLDPRKDLIRYSDEYNELIGSNDFLSEHTLYFEVDQASLTTKEQLSFEKYYKTFPKNQKLKIIVIGYTDKDGALDYNLILSKKRAETVKRKLVDAGFPIENISIYYYGEAKLTHKGLYSKELKAENRRVEIKLIKEEAEEVLEKK